jgi:serine/threonine protein kinase
VPINFKLNGDNLLTQPTIARTSMQRPHASSWVEYFPWCHQSGRRTKKRLISHVHARYAQGNILVTQDGQACLSDFGIASWSSKLLTHEHQIETLRYMAPERIMTIIRDPPENTAPFRTNDVYSLTMASFEVCFCCEPSCYLIQSLHYYQVLTGVLPYQYRDFRDMFYDIRDGKQPSRPTKRSQNRWLQDYVWDTITTRWRPLRSDEMSDFPVQVPPPEAIDWYCLRCWKSGSSVFRNRPLDMVKAHLLEW